MFIRCCCCCRRRLPANIRHNSRRWRCWRSSCSIALYARSSFWGFLWVAQEQHARCVRAAWGCCCQAASDLCASSWRSTRYNHFCQWPGSRFFCCLPARPVPILLQHFGIESECWWWCREHVPQREQEQRDVRAWLWSTFGEDKCEVLRRWSYPCANAGIWMRSICILAEALGHYVLTICIWMILTCHADAAMLALLTVFVQIKVLLLSPELRHWRWCFEKN